MERPPVPEFFDCRSFVAGKNGVVVKKGCQQKVTMRPKGDAFVTVVYPLHDVRSIVSESGVVLRSQLPAAVHLAVIMPTEQATLSVARARALITGPRDTSSLDQHMQRLHTYCIDLHPVFERARALPHAHTIEFSEQVAPGVTPDTRLSGVHCARLEYKFTRDGAEIALIRVRLVDARIFKRDDADRDRLIDRANYDIDLQRPLIDIPRSPRHSVRGGGGEDDEFTDDENENDDDDVQYIRSIKPFTLDDTPPAPAPPPVPVIKEPVAVPANPPPAPRLGSASLTTDHVQTSGHMWKNLFRQSIDLFVESGFFITEVVEWRLDRAARANNRAVALRNRDVFVCNVGLMFMLMQPGRGTHEQTVRDRYNHFIRDHNTETRGLGQPARSLLLDRRFIFFPTNYRDKHWLLFVAWRPFARADAPPPAPGEQCVIMAFDSYASFTDPAFVNMAVTRIKIYLSLVAETYGPAQGFRANLDDCDFCPATCDHDLPSARLAQQPIGSNACGFYMCEYVRLFLELTADERNRVVARWINDGVPPFYAELSQYTEQSWPRQRERLLAEMEAAYAQQQRAKQQ
jgi:hypothetical protein